MKIVAFLQNQWFKDPERIKAIIADTVKREAERPELSHRGRMDEHAVREYYISSFLFFGCLTGKRLKQCFGEELCDEIVWQEQSPQIGGKSSAAFPADLNHIRGVLERHQPTHVIALGKLACDALKSLTPAQNAKWILIQGPHPAARGPDVIDRLRAIRNFLRKVEC